MGFWASQSCFIGFPGVFGVSSLGFGAWAVCLSVGSRALLLFEAFHGSKAFVFLLCRVVGKSSRFQRVLRKDLRPWVCRQPELELT